jgi:hypothetical protein
MGMARTGMSAGWKYVNMAAGIDPYRCPQNPARMEEKTPQTAAPLGETTGERQTEQTVTGESFNEYWHRIFKALGRGMGLPDNWL